MKDRRQILKGAAAVPLAFPMLARARSEQAVKWRLASSYPKSLDTIFGISDRLAKKVALATDNEFQITVFGGGELVPALAVMDAVSSAGVEAGHTASVYYSGKDKTFALDTGVPYGMTPRQHLGWQYRGGGIEAFRPLFKKFNIINFPGGSTGVQMGGWFRKEVKSLSDLQGIKMRIPGISGDVAARLGIIPQNIPGGDTYAALERGVIDAVKWVGPYDDEKLGFNKVAKFYYSPGWWDCTGQLAFYVNLQAWEKLPKDFQTIFELAAAEGTMDMLAAYDSKNTLALKRLVGSGTQLRRFPREVLQAGYKEAWGLYAEEAARNAEFARVFGEWKKYREQILVWHSLNEATFESSLYALSRQ
ncbi:TRAP transporter substrate-binding protein [Variovorax fucosicus]|uniref:TRAP transporter substrate-binding protein n=1 Tax=Variovorax fucosicus TaxID=3053517 RepID=UPI002574C62A|nr:ABC transporter substrate-binding protein [Variovorax sp. J22G47]MDM0058884.1 ABC transporter substrate-binding protein [Variovorax sp. J22G47]